MATENGQYYDSKVIAQLFNVSVRRVQQLVQDGVIETVKTKSGRRFDLIPTIQRYIKYLQDKALGREKVERDANNESDKLEAEAKFKKAKAEVEEMKLKELRGELHRADDVEAIMTDHVLFLRSQLMSFPGKLAVDCAKLDKAPEVADRIKQEVYNVLETLASYEYDQEAFKQRVREREGWNEPNDGEE